MFTRTFSFGGRIRRTEYGISLILYFFAYFIIALASETAGSSAVFFYIPILWFFWAQGSKRCHDLGNSGWWQIIPFYGLWMLFQDGQSGSNKFGEDPKKRSGSGIPISKPEETNKFIDKKTEVSEKDTAGQPDYEKAMEYYHGTHDITEQSFSKAVIHLKKAAAMGHYQAKELLATCFYNGDGVEQSYSEALSIWEILAKDGNTNAQYNLGLCYYLGNGVDKDYVKALTLLRPACENLNDSACKLLNRIKKEIEN